MVRAGKNEPELKPEPENKPELDAESTGVKDPIAEEVKIEKEVQSISLQPEKLTKPKFDQVSVFK